MHKTLAIIGVLVLVGLVGHSITKNTIQSRNEAKTLLSYTSPEFYGGSGGTSGASGGSSGTSGISGGNSGTSGVSGGSSGDSGVSGLWEHTPPCGTNCAAIATQIASTSKAIIAAQKRIDDLLKNIIGSNAWVDAFIAANKEIGRLKSTKIDQEADYKDCMDQAELDWKNGLCLKNGQRYKKDGMK